MEKDDIGFSYAIIIPNILTKKVKVIIDSADQPIIYKKQQFLKLISDYGYVKVKPQLIEAFNRTQTILWKVKENSVIALSYKKEADSILKDLLETKQIQQKHKEDPGIIEKYSNTTIDLDDPENPVFNL